MKYVIIEQLGDDDTISVDSEYEICEDHERVQVAERILKARPDSKVYVFKLETVMEFGITSTPAGPVNRDSIQADLSRLGIR